MPDIDIDLPSGIEKSVFGTRAIIYDAENQRIKPHPSGYYLDPVPVDPETGMAAIDYQTADERGYFKVDLLTNTSIDIFESKEDYLKCLSKEPNWEMLLDPEYCKKLPHIYSNESHVILMVVQPKSVIELADVLALMRPAKIKYIQTYNTNRAETRLNLYRAPTKGIFFKKSHAVAYAQMIVAVMNKLDEVGDLVRF